MTGVTLPFRFVCKLSSLPQVIPVYTPSLKVRLLCRSRFGHSTFTRTIQVPSDTLSWQYPPLPSSSTLGSPLPWFRSPVTEIISSSGSYSSESYNESFLFYGRRLQRNIILSVDLVDPKSLFRPFFCFFESVVRISFIPSLFSLNCTKRRQ